MKIYRDIDQLTVKAVIAVSGIMIGYPIKQQSAYFLYCICARSSAGECKALKLVAALLQPG